MCETYDRVMIGSERGAVSRISGTRCMCACWLDVLMHDMYWAPHVHDCVLCRVCVRDTNVSFVCRYYVGMTTSGSCGLGCGSPG